MPEAKELIRIDKKFSKSLAREERAIKRNLLNKDCDAFLKLSQQTHELLGQLKQAKEFYDKATGEPKPVELSDSVRDRIRNSFGDVNGEQVEQELSKTLAYMKRKGWTDPRILESLLIVADGDIDEFSRACELARTDFRDLLLEARFLSD